MEIDPETLRLVLAVAKRAGTATATTTERYALHDAEQALEADRLARFPVKEVAGEREYVQPTLFDVSDYEA